jgi:vanillate O-demethylase ferredoxin subunit
MRLRVIEKQLVATEIVRIRLAPNGETRIGPFRPGAHIEIEFAGYTRRYSLTSDPEDLSCLEICALRNPLSRGGSTYLHNSLEVGDTVLVVSIAMDFNLVTDAEHSLFIAGGIGITPMVSMMTALHRLHASFELHYVASQASRFLPLPPWAFPITDYYSGRKGTRPLDVDRLCGRMGPEAHVYLCGPPELISAVRFAAARLGISSDHVHFEGFGMAARSTDQPIRLSLVRSNMTIEVMPGTPILDALLDNGVWAGFECRRGMCGSCLTQVVSGHPVHRDLLSDDQRGGAMCTCVSWASGPELALDL